MGEPVEFIRELPDWGQGEACLVRKGEQHFVVSSVDAPFTGPETLVFACNENAEVESFLDVAGGRGMSREAAIFDLQETEVSAES